MKIVVAVGCLLLCSLAHAQKPEPKPDVDKLLDKLTFTKDKASLPYRLLKPDGYDKDGKDRYPLVIFLHGAVGRGTDNKKQLRAASRSSRRTRPARSTRASWRFRSVRPTSSGPTSAGSMEGATCRSPRARPSRWR